MPFPPFARRQARRKESNKAQVANHNRRDAAMRSPVWGWGGRAVGFGGWKGLGGIWFVWFFANFW